MSSPSVEPIRAAISHLLDRGGLLGQIGSALPVYLALLESANEHGLALQTRTRLAERLSTSKDAIGASLQVLIDSGLVVRHGDSPFLVLRIVSWSAMPASGSAVKAQSADALQPSLDEVPVNGSAVPIAQDESSGDRGLGEGALVARLEAVVGPFTPSELRALFRAHSPQRVAQVLDRVRRTPDHQIKKSRLAFFRYLLSRPIHDRTPSSPPSP